MTSKTKDDRQIPEWADGDPLMEWYAATIWGKRLDDDNVLFEVMCLQVFQAGLTWRMILARRDAFRKAFQNWHIDKVADMTPLDVDRLLGDVSIIRNRKKIEACIANAQTVQGIQQQHDSFCHWFYQGLGGDDLTVLQSALRKTFKFMGPEIARMWLMAAGRIPAEH